jgi:hypothetical protein
MRQRIALLVWMLALVHCTSSHSPSDGGGLRDAGIVTSCDVTGTGLHLCTEDAHVPASQLDFNRTGCENVHGVWAMHGCDPTGATGACQNASSTDYCYFGCDAAHIGFDLEAGCVMNGGTWITF